MSSLPVENDYIWTLDRNAAAFAYGRDLLVIQWAGLRRNQEAKLFVLAPEAPLWRPMPFDPAPLGRRSFYATARDAQGRFMFFGGVEDYTRSPASLPVSARVQRAWPGGPVVFAEGEVLLADAFGESNGTLPAPWQTTLDCWRVRDGALAVTMSKPYLAAFALHPNREWTDYALECEFRHEGAALALLFRVDELTRSFYALRLNHGAKAGIFQEEPMAQLWRCRYEPDPKNHTLAHDVRMTLAEAPYTLTPGQSHTLRIEVVGRTIRAFANGTLLLSAQDPSPQPIFRGGIGLMAGTCAFQPARAHVRNLRVVALRPRPSLAKTLEKDIEHDRTDG